MGGPITAFVEAARRPTITSVKNDDRTGAKFEIINLSVDAANSG